MSNLIKREYRIKEDVVKAQFSPDIQEHISRELFDTRINEFNRVIKKNAIGSGCYVSLYLITTIIVLAVGLPITKSNAEYEYKRYGYSRSWVTFSSVVSLVYVIVWCIHFLSTVENQKTKMKAVEKVMARVNILDNPDHIFWKLDFTDKYIWEGYRKKDYYVILELSSPTITHQVTVSNPILPPITQQVEINNNPTPSIVPPQQIIILSGNAENATNVILPSDSAQATQIISIDPSQLRQILAASQNNNDNLSSRPPTPPPKYES